MAGNNPVSFASGVETLTIEFKNAAVDDAGNVIYEVDADLSNNAAAEYELLRAIMDGDDNALSAPAYSALDPSEIDDLQTRLMELAVADQDMAANQLRGWMADSMYQNNFYAGLGGPSFHEGNYDPASLNRDIGPDYIEAIQTAVRDMHQNGVPPEEAFAALETQTEAVLNGISSQIQTQIDQLREFAAGNDVKATIVEAGAEITGASPVEATINTDPQTMYELFRNLDGMDLSESPVYIALDSEGQEALKTEMLNASNWDHSHVTYSILNYIQSPGAAGYFTGDNLRNTFQEGNFDRVNPNRDLGDGYVELIGETVERMQAAEYDPEAMTQINADFMERANEIRDAQTEMIESKFEALAVEDRGHDVVTRSLPVASP